MNHQHIHFLICTVATLALSAWRVWEKSGSQPAVKNALRCEAEMQAYMAKQNEIVWG